ncbi:MAG: ABC transporter ATP-binding protein [Anaerocolumna aminovalerica]|jgi:putative ABC transport system ATP-binding protein|uniref:ABC transporter ATP-binding protein n=1 Tax=Anaerocolumna aminovalerica TaxID=1527 RepID=UPI00248C8011|nr:ABC transporter ATP-binding protein [Anaerocolumna aminovalerica]MDU6265733.1 ABC transporter ATP-binding protein [Anaerocolumna aminovalerica]
MITIQNLTKIYKIGDSTVIALDNVNLEIKKGEFLAITGPSGSGKSTLLHLMAGVDIPTSGNVFIEGKNINKLQPSEQAIFRRRHIGMIYQSFNLIPTLTVEENIILPLMLDGKKIDRAMLMSLLELLGLSDRRKHLPNQLSGGQQQRVAIGRGLMSKPSLILADEPTGNLDSENTEEVLTLLRAANENYDQTIIMVSHDENVSSIAKRRIFMKDGHIALDKVV